MTLLELGGGMPTRVTVPEARLADALARIERAPTPTARPDPTDDDA